MEQVRLFPKYFCSLLLRVLAAILVGTLLLGAVCLIPSERMEANLYDSGSTFAKEGTYPILFSWCQSKLDNWTDSLILLISAYDSHENPFVQAMSGTRNTIPDVGTPCNELIAHYHHNQPFESNEPYYQYWHGYQVIIRPLLSILNYSGIRILNGILQTSLLIILCLLMVRCGMRRYVLPYLVSVAMLMPVALAMSLQFSSCYYILTLGSIAVLLLKDRMDKLDGILFLYIGIVTAYFDFLTYPAATLGIPAVFYCCIRNSGTIRDTFCRGVKVCFSWAVGYVGMWAGKWLIGSLILKRNILTVASGKLIERSSADSDLAGNIYGSLTANIKYFLRTPALFLALLFATALLILLLRQLIKKELRFSQAAVSLFPFLILAALPIAWYLVTSQHAVIHYWFTNKNLVVSVFAGLAALVKASQKPA